MKRLVLDPTTEATGFYVQDNENENRQSEFGGSIGGPIVKNRLFFYGSYSPRIEKRDNLYNFTDATSTFGNEIWRQQAFGKLTYSQGRVTANWSTLWTPTTSDGSSSDTTARPPTRPTPRSPPTSRTARSAMRSIRSTPAAPWTSA